MMQVEFDREWPRWLPSFGLVVLLHVLAWWGYTHFKSEIVPPSPLPVVQVSLVAPPAPPEPRVTPLQSPPKAEPPVKPVMERVVSSPMPKPVPVAQPLVEHAVQQVPVALAVPTAPAPAPVQPVAEPAIEPPRYNAAYLSNPPPAYPMAARRRGIEGTVLVRAEIAEGGECRKTELKKGSGNDLLDQAALEAVRKWRFVPARRGGQAVVAWVEVPITFKLDGN